MKENKLKNDSKKINFNPKKTYKEYFIEKINIEKYPKLKKNLDLFFNDTNKYFQTTYDDKILIFGSKNRKNKYKNSSQFLEDYNKKNKIKIFKKMSTLKKYNKSSPESNNKSNSENSNFSKKNKNKEKKKKYISVDENQLKHGQRFIDDNELDSIYKTFKELHKLNKNKINNFITFKQLCNRNNNIYLKNSKGSRILSYDNNNTTSNFHKNDSININLNDKENLKKSTNNDTKFNLTFNESQNNYNNISKKSNNKTLNEIDYYKTSSTEFTHNYKSGDLKNEKFYIKLNNERMIKDIKERDKLLKKQNQYIPSKLGKSFQNEIAKNLALQEKAILEYNLNKRNQFQLIKYLSHKLNKSSKKLLLLREENYRPNIETKIKLSNLQKKLNPEKIYEWTKDIHSSEYNIINQIISSEETIRNPQNMRILSPVKTKLLENSEYISKKIPLEQLKSFKKNLGKIQKNYDCLHIDGVNLLKLEYDISKKIKGRKILNNYERLMSPNQLKSNDIYSHIDSKIINRNTKSSLRLYD